jgi:hypothetical protein
LSDWTDKAAPPSALLVNFTNVHSRATAEALARRISLLM